MGKQYDDDFIYAIPVQSKEDRAAAELLRQADALEAQLDSLARSLGMDPNEMKREAARKARMERIRAENERFERQLEREERARRWAEESERRKKEEAEKERLFRVQARENGVADADLEKYRIYLDAKKQMTSNYLNTVKEAESKFRSIPGWMDADPLAESCTQRVKELEAKEEQARIRQEEEKRKADRYERANSLVSGNYSDADK